MKQIRLMIIALSACFVLSACAEVELGSHFAKTLSGEKTAVGDFKVGNPYKVKGRTYYPKETYEYSETGVASWYGPGFHGKMTANGEIFNRNDLTAAHKTLQLPSIVRVTNLNNGKSIILRVNDRGPFSSDRILDVSEKAAELLGFKNKGTTRIRLDVMEDESRIVASAAKQGISTRGTEVALNRRQPIDDLRIASPTPTTKPYDSNASAPVQVASLNTSPPRIITAPPKKMEVVDITSQSNSFNNSVISKVISKPVQSYATPQDIFIQTGAFSNEDNALTLKQALYNLNQPVNVYRNVETDGNILYRVKIGPVATVEKADEIINMLDRQGRNATMVIANR